MLKRFQVAVAVAGALGLAAIGIQASAATYVANATTPGGTQLKCTIVGTAKNDVLKGTAGNDVICGLGGNDVITGLGGNDVIDGGAGNDSIDGGIGNDTLVGGVGNDKVVGGAGENTFSLLGSVSAINLSLLTNKATGQGTDTLSGIQDVIGSNYNDTITGSNAVNVISGGNGNDVIDAGAGNDKVNGGAGNDSLEGGLGNDNVAGGLGSDTLVYSDNTTGVSVDLAAGTESGDGTDVISGDENVIGGSGNDVIKGDAYINMITGGEGNDRISGGDGNDLLYGGAGNDGLLGGAGSDVLSGADAAPAVTERNLCEHDANDQVTYCGFDENAPWIASATLSATEVDSSATAQTVVVTMHVTDELMGVDYAGCSLMLEGARMSTGYARAVRTSGDALDGVYTCNVTIPRGGTMGRWGLNFDTRDKAGNLGLANQGANGKWHSNLPEIMAQTPEHWLNQTGVGDSASPRIIDPTFSVTTVDTSAADATVTVQMTVTDDFSGVDRVNCAPRHGIAIDFKQGYGYGVATQLSGDAMSGVWSCTFKLPTGAGHGKWGVAIYASDKTGKNYSMSTDFNNENKWIVDDTALQFVPPAVTSTSVNYFTQTGAGDDTAPVLLSIDLDRTNINASSSDQRVVATLTVAPEQWGTPRVIVFDVFSPATMAEHQSPCTLTTTNSDGSTIWSCPFTIQIGSAKGLFPIMVWLADDAGNRADFRGDPVTATWRTTVLNESGNRVDLTGLTLGPVGVTNSDH
ncbi:MAG: calcium-binding protein [Rhodoluna sp.]|nr:calcium-binding protein [Rhodoluna sp.]